MRIPLAAVALMVAAEEDAFRDVAPVELAQFLAAEAELRETAPAAFRAFLAAEGALWDAAPEQFERWRDSEDRVDPASEEGQAAGVIAAIEEHEMRKVAAVGVDLFLAAEAVLREAAPAALRAFLVAEGALREAGPGRFAEWKNAGEGVERVRTTTMAALRKAAHQEGAAPALFWAWRDAVECLARIRGDWRGGDRPPGSLSARSNAGDGRVT